MSARGWFTIPGVQAGERTLKERINGLGAVRHAARGKSVLDLGCAEGLIGKWLIDAVGAASLHGLDKHPPYVELARKLMAGYPAARFGVADFDSEDWIDQSALEPSGYDVVLALNIAHKLVQPAAFLSAIAARCNDVLALALPQPVISDARSCHVRVDPVTLLRGEFELIDRHDGYVHPTKGHFGIRMIFRRVG